MGLYMLFEFLLISLYNWSHGFQCKSFSLLCRGVSFFQVANDVIMSRNTSEWLQKYALEQLSELAAHLYRILVGCSKHIQEKTRIIDLILELLMSTLKISQKRKVYQPHFTISFEGLYHLYEAVDVCCSGTFSSTAETGLKAVLMSTPPVSILHMVSLSLSLCVCVRACGHACMCMCMFAIILRGNYSVKLDGPHESYQENL